MRIFIGCSSRDNIDEKYKEDCKKLLEEILRNNDLVFGASNTGLMGMAYRIAKENRNTVTGILPELYIDSLKELDCDHAIVTKTMVESTLKIYESSDAIVILPGGFGTFYELFLTNYCKITKDINLPVIIYNSCGFYDQLLSFIDYANKENFIRDGELGQFIVANTPEEVISYLKKELNK